MRKGSDGEENGKKWLKKNCENNGPLTSLPINHLNGNQLQRRPLVPNETRLHVDVKSSPHLSLYGFYIFLALMATSLYNLLMSVRPSICPFVCLSLALDPVPNACHST